MPSPPCTLSFKRELQTNSLFISPEPLAAHLTLTKYPPFISSPPPKNAVTNLVLVQIKLALWEEPRKSHVKSTKTSFNKAAWALTFLLFAPLFDGRLPHVEVEVQTPLDPSQAQTSPDTRVPTPRTALWVTSSLSIEVWVCSYKPGNKVLVLGVVLCFYSNRPSNSILGTDKMANNGYNFLQTNKNGLIPSFELRGLTTDQIFVNVM